MRQDYVQKASVCFNKVADILKDSSGLPFWHVGRTFNTCQDYITQNAAGVRARDVDRYNNEVRPKCTSFYLEQAGNSDNQQWWWTTMGGGASPTLQRAISRTLRIAGAA
jgi:hypothetical protein